MLAVKSARHCKQSACRPSSFDTSRRVNDIKDASIKANATLKAFFISSVCETMDLSISKVLVILRGVKAIDATTKNARPN